MTSDTQPAGATPAAEGATPSQTPAQPAPAAQEPTPQPATGDEGQLGDAGKRALAAERTAAREARERAEAAERQLEELRTASQSDQEKALTQARKEGETTATQKWEALVRRTSVQAALQAAGSSDPAIVALAPEFAALKVTDEGGVEGLADALEAFRSAHPTLFGAATPPPPTPASADGGARGSGGGAGTFTREQLRDPEFYNANREAIAQASREGRIR